jgi:GTP diphosphokinase / guanosine-3',5'-bis(diphosphate) 3'-diphosphatase
VDQDELEDLAFRYLHPDEYQELVELVAKKRRARDEYTALVEKDSEDALAARNFEHLEVYGRAKHFYSIYSKLQRQQVEFDQIYDLIAFRAIVDTVSECYEALGVVHTIWKPIPGRFKDYIALPKGNGYQSLHTAVIGPYGERMEIQIRTREMHRIAEQGIAAHWKYKEGRSGIKGRDEEHFAWLKQLVQVQQELVGSRRVPRLREGRAVPRRGLRVHPQGGPEGLAAGRDAARFRLHGAHGGGPPLCGRAGQRADGTAPHPAQNGDRVEVMTSSRGKPNRDWLKFVKSGGARNKIRAFLRQEQREMSREIGRGLIEKELRKRGRSLDKLLKSGELGRAAKELKCQTFDDLCVLVGFRKVTAETVGDLVAPEGGGRRDRRPPKRAPPNRRRRPRRRRRARAARSASAASTRSSCASPSAASRCRATTSWAT